MYQMYAYSKKYEVDSQAYKAPAVWLLYPVNEELRNHPDIIFMSDDGVTVHLFFVDVANIEESLTDLKKQMQKVL